MINYANEITMSIVSGMLPFIDTELTDKLRSVCLLALSEYDMAKKQTEIIPYESLTNETLLKKFCVIKKVEGCTDKTAKQYFTVIRNALKRIGKSASLITADDIMIYLADREINDKCSKVTLDNELRYMRSFFTYLTSNEIIMRNPTTKIKAIKTPKRKKKAFTDKEVERIRVACQTPVELALVEVMLSTGCRVTEVSELPADAAQTEKITIIGKGNKERVVYMNAKAQLAAEALISSRSKKSEFLFPNKDGNHITSGRIETIIRELGKRAGVTQCHPHKFRRTFATNALKRGMPLELVSRMLGHEQIATTQIYLDLDDYEVEAMHKKYVV